ncbi:MAG: hypothetical protein LBE62_02470 [Azonexus sp.]|jgi:anti-anti-sigma regulatory factor|nr:hypothetical protein [Azonexus sp.]
MVFSFFKKPTQKMPARRVAKPRAPALEPVSPQVVADFPEEAPQPLPDLEFTNSRPSGVAAPAAKARARAASPALEPPMPASAFVSSGPVKDDFDDTEFAESYIMGINVEDDNDPVQGEIEHAVVLFANGQEAAARSLLETLIRAYPGDEGRRFWLLLLDLLQCVGDRAAFDKLALEFAQTCETSPPTWRQTEPLATPKNNNQRHQQLQGVLTAGETPQLAELSDWVARRLPVVIECGKLVGCDDEVAGQLAAILHQARRAGVPVALNGIDPFLNRLNERLTAGEAGRESAWALLLELLQRHGPQERFEERAVDYAVTFEVSPPSWEERAPTPEDEPEIADVAVDDIYYLKGDLKNRRFEELAEFIESREQPVIDFAGVQHMDFFSAGQLVNRLAPYKTAGREILVRSPNHLIAELMAVVGLNKQARIIVPKS